jgi:predicted RecB family nuclease
MPNREADYEKDYLVINRREGKFYNFRWYPSDQHLPEEVRAMLKKWNESDCRKTDGLAGEMITDPLVREICAYRENGRSYQDIINRANEVQESIDKAVEKLEYALEELNGIRGLN